MNAPTANNTDNLRAVVLRDSGRNVEINGWLAFFELINEIRFNTLAVIRLNDDTGFCGFLRDAGLEGNLYNSYFMGGYLAYWLAPTMRVFAAGTLNYPPSVAADHRAIAALGSQAGELYVEASDAAQVSPKQESSWRAVEEALEKLRMNLYAELLSRYECTSF